MEPMIVSRDFSSVSPSARWLLLMKGYTNSFESFKEAQLFFKKMGFVIDKKAKVIHSEMSSLKYLKRSITLRQFFRLILAGKLQATWRLKAV